jgi:hypothetical protein
VDNTWQGGRRGARSPAAAATLLLLLKLLRRTSPSASRGSSFTSRLDHSTLLSTSPFFTGLVLYQSFKPAVPFTSPFRATLSKIVRSLHTIKNEGARTAHSLLI